jgi:hypothetical protein
VAENSYKLVKEADGHQKYSSRRCVAMEQIGVSLYSYQVNKRNKFLLTFSHTQTGTLGINSTELKTLIIQTTRCTLTVSVQAPKQVKFSICAAFILKG